MKSIKNQLLPIERLTPEVGHYFFGYYDLQPWSGDGFHYLCHRVGFRDRIPTAADFAEIGMFHRHEGKFTPLAKTAAWNFQQGSMLQWNPARPNDEIIYNASINGAFRGVILNIITGEKRLLSHPVANIDPTGRWALSTNFSRQFDFRPGYGYAGIDDPFKNEPTPADDGVFLVDMISGESKEILSLEFLRSFFPELSSPMDKLVLNAITFNTDGTRFLALIRNMPRPGQPFSLWKTVIVTANTDGSQPHLLIGPSYVSHYHWRDPGHVLFHAKPNNQKEEGLYLLRDLSDQVEIIDSGYFTFDGHCNYSPDRNFILYDSYPDADAYRHLMLYDLRNRKGHTLALVPSEHLGPELIDIRCDLHPRWNRDGTTISFDSIHEGQRGIYTMDVRQLLLK